MKSIALGRMLKDGRHVVGCRYSLDDALLAARLVQSGLEARLYAGKGEGRVVDLARQFVRMRADAFVLAVDPDTAALMRQIALQIRLLLPATRIFMRGPVGESQRQALRIEADGMQWLPGSMDDCVAELAAIAGVPAVSAPLDDTASPYLGGLIREDDLPRIGLSADQPLSIFKKELAWLSGKPEIESRIAVQALTRSGDELKAIAELIRQSGPAHRFSLRADPAACPAELIAEFEQAPDADRLQLDTGISSASHAQGSFGINGTIALHTGIYADPVAGIRHLEVSSTIEPAQRRAAYDWAAPHMASRSAVVFDDAEPANRERLEQFVTPLVPETQGWPLHSYLIAPAPSTPGGATVTFDADSQRPAQAIRRLPLSQLDWNAVDGQAITVVSVSAKADIEAFEHRLKTFSETGRIHIGDPRQQIYFENSCRWTRRGTCQLNSLKRVQIREAGRLGACRDAGTVGSIGDSHDEIVMRLKRDQQTQSIRRECAVCPVRDDCSQCTQLPADWGGRYCEIRKAHRCAPLFIEIFSMAHGLAPLFGNVDDLGRDGLELLVSYSGLPNQHFGGAANDHGESERQGQRPVILSANGRHIAWWRGSRKLCRLSAPLALMAEAWWSRGQEEQIVDDLAAKFSVSGRVASSSLKSGVEKLRSEGIIHA